MFGSGQTLPHTPELARIAGLARRMYTRSDIKQATAELTRIFKRPGGNQTLLEIQALALLEIGMFGGLFGSIRVGEGKTLICLLAPIVARSSRPLLLIRANLREKTRRDTLRYGVHWNVAKYIRVESYAQLGRKQSANMLWLYRPDLIISDECHHLRSLKNAACARRVDRYMRDFPYCKFVGLSGTVVNSTIADYAHLVKWSLKDNTPIPRRPGELMQWCDVLDRKINPARRIHPGAMIALANESEERTWLTNPTLGARKAFRRRLEQTPGIVCSKPTQLDCPLIIATKKVDLDQKLVSAFHTLRTDWRTPDDWPVSDGLSVRRHAYQLALGYYSYWDPRPPDPWMNARKDWCSECRSIISSSHTWDSESHVIEAIDRGTIRSLYLEPWRDIRDTFTPNVKARWLSDQLIKFCAVWMRRPGIVWTNHVPFAQRLAYYTDSSYYGEEGLNAAGQYIESASSRRACVASIGSNSEGRNLQHAFNRSLITAPPANALQWEQILGRTHRRGQKAHEVTCDVLLSCIEHHLAIESARELSEVIIETMPGTDSFKLLNADCSFHSTSELVNIQRAQWQKTTD